MNDEDDDDDDWSTCLLLVLVQEVSQRLPARLVAFSSNGFNARRQVFSHVLYFRISRFSFLSIPRKDSIF